MTRTVLVHLNLQVPAENTSSVEQLQQFIEGALEVGTDVDNDEAQCFNGVRWSIPLAEEV